MSVRYDRLFTLLAKKGLTISKLTEDLKISSTTRAKFAKSEYVSLTTIHAICRYLNCTVDEVLEFENIIHPSALLKRLKAEQNQKIKGGIYHESQIVMTYNSNRIEGSKLSESQTRYIFETNTISADAATAVNVDDVIETTNHFRCIDYVIETVSEPVTESLVKDLHRILKTGTSDARQDWFRVGDYKLRPNTVGGAATASPQSVERKMASLIGTYENIVRVTFEDILAFHHDFEAIHPFQDGNGRVGRLIAFKECLRRGFVPFIIDETIKMFYYRGLKEWQNERGYLIDTCKTGQDRYKQLLDYYQIEQE
ncbi:MAG: Fic family protein [Bacillota bacterium]|nr:Fic family protein [Bacillota bacterium]